MDKPPSALVVLAVKVVLSIFAAEVLLHAAFEIAGRHHATENWVAGVIGSVIAMVVGSAFRKRK